MAAEENGRLVELELRETRFLLKETIRRARNAERSLGRLQESVAYKLGVAILDTLKSPAGAVRLPIRLLSMARMKLFDNPPEKSRRFYMQRKDDGIRRVVVAGHDLRFISPISDALERSGKVRVRKDQWLSQDRFDPSSSEKAVQWADTVVAEWCLGNAVWYSKNIPSATRLVVRFHLRERASMFPDQVQWENVYKVIFVGPHVLDEACSLLGVPRSKAVFIPNMVPVERFSRKKKAQAHWTIGMLGYTPMRKRLDRVLDTFEALWTIDRRWRLRIKGVAPEHIPWMNRRDDELEWYELLRKRIDSSDWKDSVCFDPAGDDVPAWLETVGYLLSPSDFESFHMAVGEAMASGAIPVIWPWMGCWEIWPEEFLVDDTKQAVDLLSELAGNQERRRSLSTMARDFVKTHYGIDRILQAWEELLAL